jgi:hypothetical protein
MMKRKYDAAKLADLGYGDYLVSVIELTDIEVAELALVVGGTVEEIESCRIDRTPKLIEHPRGKA